MRLKTLTIGADPELAVYRNGHVYSGHNFPFGTKQQPMKTEHGSVQVDGVALECNVTPATTREEFLKNLSGVLHDLRKMVREADKVCELVPCSSVYFGRTKLSQLPPDVAALGCNPDWSAYTMQVNPRPNENVEFRTFAGHIHIGWTEGANPRSRKHLELCGAYAKQLDYYLGVPSLIWDLDPRRRELYGKAGCFRPKPYGLEYRVLGSMWLKSPKLAGFVFDQAVEAIRAFDRGDVLFEQYGLLAQTWINAGTRDWARAEPELAKTLIGHLELNDDIPF